MSKLSCPYHENDSEVIVRGFMDTTPEPTPTKTYLRVKRCNTLKTRKDVAKFSPIIKRPSNDGSTSRDDLNHRH